ncbi:MAG TPA: dTDP-4-dehydrorhamnose reductase [Bacteriovoracaceae bacterium]|nr:dTDP-4-dehydrorhamnose reductase [Bacteriovoracaceae bacterium]
MEPLEMWAGLECTLNRVGERYIDQSEKNGHNKRLSDLKLFADLNVKKIRYPCLWELVAPDDLDHFDWSYMDERLGEIKRLGITPIAGFLHHGSGPRYTNLLDPDFPTKLASYARAFATRYPWIEDFTPVNEILTTARFSCLYGHWYPHARDHSSFVKAVFNQVKGTILAMRAIREIIPGARLIQTDDLGRAQSTEPLKYQVDFENERRWLGWDLLCGKTNKDHHMAWYLRGGMQDEDFDWIINNPCPPDVIGVNHYHLSNRFLDHRMELYPEWAHGGNGIDKYADLGAVDTGQSELLDPESVLMETWERYYIPIAVTEVHTMGHRDAQMRWLYQMWNAAKKARALGADIKAITPWSLLGTYDWHKLCTICEMFYEPGVYDLRSSDKKPRQTGLSSLITELSTNGDSKHPILQTPGWWQTPRRILWASKTGAFSPLWPKDKHRPIVITGATGTLGQAFARICGARNIPYSLLRRTDMDIADKDSVLKVLTRINPWAVINTAGYVNVDAAESDSDKCFRENVQGATNLAAACAEQNIAFITFSSDLVFDGTSAIPYLESDKVSPLNVYGRSKAESETRVMEVNDKALIIRTSSFFGPWDKHNFVINTLRLLASNTEVTALNDSIITPTYIPDLVNATLDLLLDGENGIVHLTNKGEVSWADFARIAAETAKCKFELDPALIIGKSIEEMNLKAKRPRNSTLGSERFEILPSLEDAINRYFNQLEIHPQN